MSQFTKNQNTINTTALICPFWYHHRFCNKGQWCNYAHYWMQGMHVANFPRRDPHTGMCLAGRNLRRSQQHAAGHVDVASAPAAAALAAGGPVPVPATFALSALAPAFTPADTGLDTASVAPPAHSLVPFRPFAPALRLVIPLQPAPQPRLGPSDPSSASSSSSPAAATAGGPISPLTLSSPLSSTLSLNGSSRCSSFITNLSIDSEVNMSGNKGKGKGKQREVDVDNIDSNNNNIHEPPSAPTTPHFPPLPLLAAVVPRRNRIMHVAHASDKHPLCPAPFCRIRGLWEEREGGEPTWDSFGLAGGAKWGYCAALWEE